MVLPLILCSPYIRKLFCNGFLVQHQDAIVVICISTAVLVCIYIEGSLGDNCVNCMFTFMTQHSHKAIFVSQCALQCLLNALYFTFKSIFSTLHSLILYKEKRSHQNLMYIVSIHYVIWCTLVVQHERFIFSSENCIMKDSQDICCHTHIDVVFV